MTSADQSAYGVGSPVRMEGSRGKARVVIVGGGFGGINAARALKRCDADVVLIDRRNHHLFQPLLYQVATASLAPAEIAAPIRQLAGRQRNLSVMMAEVTGIDLQSSSIETYTAGFGSATTPFDYLVVATGVESNYFGHDEFAAYAPSLKTITDAEVIRTKILRAYELAELNEDPAERAKLLTFVVVGGGATGVELAASIAQMATVTLRSNFRRIDPGKSSILLIEGGKRILPTFHESLAAAAAKRLEELGVKVLTGANVERVDEDGVLLAGNRIASATVVWAAGVAPSPIVKMLGATTDRSGRVCVGPNLELPDKPGIFVVGDAAAITQDGRLLPGLAQVAIQSGDHVGRLIARDIAGRASARPFRYRDRGNLAVVGTNFAVLERRNIRLSGFAAWLLWVFVHLMFLPQLQNRLRVQTQWFWGYFSGQRSSRLIAEAPTLRQSDAVKARIS
jgi:NADH:quinone reductase (non-electrogenic)